MPAFFKAVSAFLAIGLLSSACTRPLKQHTDVKAMPQIFPDYTSIVIPANIAPLNFHIDEKGSEFLVEIYSLEGEKIRIRQTSPDIKIPIDKWNSLLAKNKGNALNIDVYAKNETWYSYASISDTIAKEGIDNHLVYRLFGIIYSDGNKMGIYQRNLENFDQSVIFDNTSNPKTPCINCHSFSGNSPGKMSLHIRKAYAGTAIFDNGTLTKYNTKTENSVAPAAYTAWHPSGDLIAFSVNRLFVYFTSNAEKLVEVCDQVSDLVLYNLETNTLTTSPKISSLSRENLPNWSPDGKTLYFISTLKGTENMSSWVEAKYDLLSIPYNIENNTWGEIDTLLTSKQTGLSITWPVASPDGRYILFCMIDHSYFSIFDKNSDLYLYDLKTKQYRKTDILNSTSTESYHAWSKNGRWITFSSKRLDEISTRPFFSYFDADGNFHKPFVLPQEDPLYYQTDTMNFNLPVLVDGKVEIDAQSFQNFITNEPSDVNFDKSIKIDTMTTFAITSGIH
jgi:hypothetical protein